MFVANRLASYLCHGLQLATGLVSLHAEGSGSSTETNTGYAVHAVNFQMPAKSMTFCSYSYWLFTNSLISLAMALAP